MFIRGANIVQFSCEIQALKCFEQQLLQTIVDFISRLLESIFYIINYKIYSLKLVLSIVGIGFIVKFIVSYPSIIPLGYFTATWQMRLNIKGC